MKEKKREVLNWRKSDWKETEVQRVRSEYDLKVAQMQYDNGELEAEPDQNGGQSGIRRVGSRPAAMKALKLPPSMKIKMIWMHT